MKAIRVNGWGQPLQLEDIAQPKPANDEVLVHVHAASVNPFDAAVHAGYMQGFLSLPLTLGTDFAGKVVETGADVKHVKAGDEVYGMVSMQEGSFAEYLVAKVNEVTHKPKTLDFVQAAGTPLANMAAYQSLFDLGQAQKGERILIIGASGSVGGGAIQLAKELGAYVYGVDIPDKADFARELGVDRFINAREERYEELVENVDLVLDFVGGENLKRSYSLLQAGGRYVTSLMLETPQEEPQRRGFRSVGLGTQARVDQLDELRRRIDAGRLKIFVDRTFPLAEAQSAMEYRMKTTNPGKIVLIVE
jgi:NADPH:quinone reductase-like Zn-dependent oxidoreductase